MSNQINQITREYYMHLITLINNGTTTKKVYRKLNNNGKMFYFTYHIVK